MFFPAPHLRRLTMVSAGFLAAASLTTLWLARAATNESVSPYPFRKGTRWTLKNGGTPLVSVVEGFTSVATPDGTIQAAVVRRSDQTDRAVLRTSTQWIDCKLFEKADKKQACAQPIVFFEWPLSVGHHWASGGFNFVVTGQEPLKTAFREFPLTWKISYTPAGSSDPLGEFWFAEGVGRVRLREAEVTLDLIAYEPGQGPELPASSDKAVAGFVTSAPGPKVFPKRPGVLDRLWRTVRQSTLFPLFLLQGLLLAVFLVLGAGIWRAVRTRREWLPEATGPGEADPTDESKLLAALTAGGEVSRVEERLNRMVSEHPAYPDLRHHLALVKKALGKPDEARRELEKALELNPRYIDAHLSLAQLHMETADPDQAAAHFTIVTEQRPQFADAHFGLAKARFAQKLYSEAETSLQAALKLNPALAAARTLLDQCRKMTQNGAA